ncbi:MAG: SusC/RagA family TonB-linked outer membrane protein [Bacteroidetes bacterium]|nr:SusC/RagA family TonB-linked outer membrane protein [Bacteroidota bacterium]
MRLTVFFLLVACLEVSAAGYAQRVSLSEKNVPLQKVFKHIERQTGYDFVYNTELLNEAQKVSIEVHDVDLLQVLELCIKGQPLSYTIIGKTIVIRARDPLPPAPAAASAPAIAADRDPLTGVVVDENGKPVAYASVIVKYEYSATGLYYSPMGGQTNERGEFKLPPLRGTGAAVLFVTAVGYSPFKQPIGPETNRLRIRLVMSDSRLSEMVITGYSSKKASEVTGSVQTIKGDDLRNSVTTVNSLAMLKGKAAGLYIVESGGSVATRGQVVMRGQASFNDLGNTNFGPLIVLDGVITTAANLQDIVDPGDIESVTILKDAASTAIYGSRAAQGVIVVTTKRGAAGKLTINLNANYGKVQNNRLVHFMNTDQLTTHINKYMQSMYAGSSSLQSAYGSFQNYFNTTRIYTDADLKTNTNWDNDAFFTDGNQSNVNLSLSSGTEKTRFFGAASWVKQDGTLLDDNLDRKNARVNIDQRISDKLSLSLNTNAIIDKYTSTNSENQYYLFEPWVSPNYANGELADSIPNYVYRSAGARGTTYYDNPLYSHGLNTIVTLRQNYLGTGRIKYAITPWLSLQSTNTAQYIYNNVNSYKDPRTYRGRYDGPATNRIYVNGELAITDTRTNYYITSNQLNFNKHIGEHSLSALVGQEYSKTHVETFAASAYNTPYPGERNLGAFQNYGTWINVLQGTPATPSSAAPVDKASFSVFSEVNDSYKNRYFGSASVRRDASTNFGRDKRYGTFYSLSGGWLVSGEDFMRSVKPISNLKLRASYGTSGREAGADYLNFTVYQDLLRYNDLNTYGSTIQRLGNDQITWETTYTTNLGIDLGLWKRIHLTVDYYNRRSSGLLQTVSLPSYVGFTSQIRNIGELTNRGVDLTLTTENIQTKNFSWTTDFNISFNRNTLTKIYGDSLKDGFSGAYYRYKGDDINTLRAIKYDGVNPDNGRPLFERLMADKSVTLVDSIPLAKQDGLRSFQKVGSATPKFFGGMTNTFRYKGFTLTTLLNFVYGNKIMNNAVRSFLDPTAWQSGFNLPQPNKAIRLWQGPGDKNANYSNYYDLAFFQRGLTNISSSRLIVDASYIRLRNVRLGYDIPTALLRKTGVASLSIYASADNVFVTRPKDLYASDPEGATIGGTSTQYSGTGIASAMPRKFLFGINVGF